MTSMDATSEPLRLAKWKRRLLVAISSLAVVAVCVTIKMIGGREPAQAQTPAGRGGSGAAVRTAAANNQPGPLPVRGNAAPLQASDATSSQQPIVAVVNNEEIHRQELAQECLSQFGKEVLETVMNKYLILSFCEKKGIKVTKEEVEEEIDRMARKFAIPVDQWYQMLQQERGIKPEQYKNDIIWPTLALRKLAADRIQPTEQEIDDAYETQFGTAVKARLIVVEDANKAQEIWQAAKKNPTGENFGLLARKHSIDTNSASLNGMIQPIRRHLGDPKVEEAAFRLKDGEISPVIAVNGQFAILRCEGFTQSSDFKKEQVRGRLEEFVRERKLRGVAGELFKKLQDESQLVNVYNDPQKRQQMPGIAATINGKTVTIRELSEQCINRHGEEVLEVMIHRKLLEQELKKRNVTITQKDIDAEIGRAAVAAGKLKADHTPNAEAWLKMVEEQGVPYDKYVRDSVWPSTALKLIAGDVKITDEDIKRGYEANYGSKAQVRAIVLDNQRQAQTVWQKARENPSIDFFGKLAEQYSVEPASRSNAGRVPPIQRFGGQPELEKEAFALKPGEISGIVQVVDKFVVLYLEGFTKPVQVKPEEVRSLIYEDVHEKKQRLAMAREFDKMKDTARITNYLAGTDQSPEKTARTAEAKAKSPDGSAAPDGVPNVAIPAGYQTTGLLPRSQPAGGNAKSGPQPDATMPRSGSALPSRQ